MKLSYLKEFIVLANSETVSDACTQLLLEPLTLYRHIKALEEGLGETLVDRKRGRSKVAITKAGQHFLPYAKSMVNTWSEASEKISKLSDSAPFVVAGVNESIEHYLLQAKCFQQLKADGIYSFKPQLSSKPDELARIVLENEADCCFGYALDDDPFIAEYESDFTIYTIANVGVFLTSQENLETENSELHVSDLVDFEFSAPSNQASALTLRLLKKVLRERGQNRASDTTAFKPLSFMGVSPLDTYDFLALLDDGFFIYPISKESFSVPFEILCKKGNRDPRLFSYINALKKLMTKHFNEREKTALQKAASQRKKLTSNSSKRQ